MSVSLYGICAVSETLKWNRKPFQEKTSGKLLGLQVARRLRAPALTFERGLGSRHQEELLALLALPALAGVVAQRVAAALLAVQAQALAEAVHAAAQVGRALQVGVHQGVDEEVHRPLVGAFYGLGEGWNTGQEGR